MKQVAGLILIFILSLSSKAQRADPPLPPAVTSTASVTPNTAEAGPLGKSDNNNTGQNEYRKKYNELLDSLALKNENELKQNADDLSKSYRNATYGIVGAGVVICALLGIIYGLYQKNKTLKNELRKLRP